MAALVASPSGTHLRRDPSRGRLSRAGWSLVSSGSQASFTAAAPEPQWEAEGARLVSEVAQCWSDRYIFTIRQSGAFEGAYHYECLFSRPTDAEPVPGVVISVRFALVVMQAQPRLLYSFEEGDLRHEWALQQGSGGRWYATQGQQNATLNCKAFERYLDAYIREKVKVRSRGIDLATAFEASRLSPPPQCHYAGDDAASGSGDGGWHEGSGEGQIDAPVDGEDEASREITEAMKEALRAADMYCDKVEPPSSLTELLANIFDAADEEDVGELPHLEVARVLTATLSGFGLEEWDIQLLLTSAQENDDGFIEWKPFIQAAPEVVQALRTRRRAYKARGLPGVEIPEEAVKHCFSDEFTITVEAMITAFSHCAQEDPTRGRYEAVQANAARAQPNLASGAAGGRRKSATMSLGSPSNSFMDGEPLIPGGDEHELVALKRRYCRECVESLTERLSPQEAQRLMQMLPEDEDGFVQIDELEMRLEHLRTQALLNGLVETNINSLRMHLVLNFRKCGMTPEGKLKIWQIKQALLQADQVCLSRLQIHVLLCFAAPNNSGDVDVKEFCGICCVVIPHMCDAKIFVETAERLANEHAEALKERANAELAALGAARAGKADNDDEKKDAVVEVDQETVERSLNQVFALSDNTHRNPPVLSPETMWTVLNSTDATVQSCQLSEVEICGLAAEMAVDANGEVAYQQHLKRWIPIIYELRKSQFLACYLKETAAEVLGIPEPDFGQLEKMFPLLPPGTVKAQVKSESPMQSKTSIGGTESRRDRHSKEERMGSKLSMRAARSMRAERSMAAESTTEGHDQLAKEPPPGRGYQRRRNRLVAEGATMVTRSPSKTGADDLPPGRRSLRASGSFSRVVDSK